MSTGTKGSAKRTRLSVTGAATSERPQRQQNAPVTQQEEPEPAAVSQQQQPPPPAKKLKSAVVPPPTAESQQATPKKNMAVEEAPKCLTQAASVGQASTSCNTLEVSSASKDSCKKEDLFKKLYTNTVQESYLGNLNIEGNNLNKPGSVVFALSLLQSKFGRPFLAHAGHKNQPKSHGREGLDEEFRAKIVEPHIEKLVAGAESHLQDALKFIISAAKSDIKSNDCCSEGGAFPIMKEIKIKVLNTVIGCPPFEWSPAQGKYNSDEVSGSYFVAIKKISMMFVGNPLFRFKDRESQKEYFEEYMGTVYEALSPNIDAIKANKQREIENQNKIMEEEIKALEERVSKITRAKGEHKREMGDRDEKITCAVEKKINAQRAHEAMEAALINLSNCMDSSSNGAMYEKMKEDSKKNLNEFVEKQNKEILDLEEQKKEIEANAKTSDDEIKQHRESMKSLRARVNDTEEKLRIEVETEESVIKSQINQAIDSYINAFHPITQCIESSPNAKREILDILKKITESDEVIQEGILAMRNSIETFLERSIEAASAAKEDEHPAPPPPEEHSLM